MNPHVRKWWQRCYKIYGVRGQVRLGQNVHIGIGSILDSHSGLVVGDDVYIGKYCTSDATAASDAARC